jgi:peptidyl-dipeptidase A
MRPLLYRFLPVLLALAALPGCRHRTAAVQTPASSVRTQAAEFLAFYNGVLPDLTARQQEAQWAASTDVSERHTGGRIGAESVYAGFAGSGHVVRTARALLEHEAELDDVTRRQLRFVLLDAAYAPGSNPDLARRRIEAEARQSELQDGFSYCLEAHAPGTPCPRPATANDIDRLLRTSRDLAERERVWTRSKDIGDPLRTGLLELRDLRNDVAREMGYSDFYALQIADYGMSTAEMMALLDRSIEQVRPLFRELQCFARRRLATRYGAPVPTGAIPAHWLGNRWAQSWPGLVESVDLDPLMADRSAEWMVRTAERYYVSMGFDPLPATFWTKSDLYPLPPGSSRRKNSHASAWHMDLGSDVRSLMSVEPDAHWFATAHHELGHIYYYQSYARPEVPPVLRRGANRAFHEGIGELISMSVLQEPYLRSLGVLSADRTLDAEQMLLSEALDKGPVFFMFAAGTMAHFEHDLYAARLSPEELNARWWQYVREYQGVEPPTARDESHCDACTKTHINDDPAQYYDYALATLLQFQLHEHFCRTIVHADPHACTYENNREVGAALRRLLAPGASRDWRTMLRETTGEDLSAAAMLRYFEPLRAMLARENAGQSCGE